MDGIGLLSNYRGTYLGDPRLDPIFAELNRRKAVVFVHPTEPLHFDTLSIGLPAPVMEFPFESTRMALNLVQTGINEKFSDITIIVAHGGGTLPYTYQRFVKYWMDGKNDIFDTFCFDLTATTEPAQLRALMSLAEADRCLMGFDFPFMDPHTIDPLQQSLEHYDFSAGELRSIQHENALRLFPRMKDRLRRGGMLGSA